ncbi:MAG: AAC(3) family N-acetyltransferase [Candidatus Limnocylindrales bacterium]
MARLERRKAQITQDLRALGLRAGDLVMVHASLRRIGPVEGRADGVIAAILEAIAPGGTMLMVLGAADDHAWVNERPESEREKLLAEAEPFHPLRAPADPEVGTLAEVFRTYPGTVVSDHPEGRFAAHGSLARELLDDVPWDDYFGPGSPLESLVRRDGRVLRLGADHDTVTALHLAEYRCSLPSKRRVRRYRRVATASGSEVRVVDALDDDGGIVDYPGEDYFADLMRDYLASGAGHRGPVGGTAAELLVAADVVDFGARWMDEHLAGSTSHWTVPSLRRRLDADLLDARRRGATAAVAAIRALKASVANAEAVPVPERPFELVEGRADVPRRALSGEAIAAVIDAEIDEHRRAVEVYRRLGQPTAGHETGLATLQRYRARS